MLKADASFSSLEWEVLFRNSFSDAIQARVVVIDCCCTYYDRQISEQAPPTDFQPVNYEIRAAATAPEAARKAFAIFGERVGPG